MNRESLISKEDYVFYEDKRIWSKRFKCFLNGTVNKYGYVQVGLKCVDGKIRLFLWHRVIWYMFNGEIPDGYEINHIDENKQNNALSNLNLMTHKENINWGTANKKRKEVSRPDVVEKRSKPVVAVDKDNNIIYEYPSVAEAGRQGFNQCAVSQCCRNCYGKLGNYFKGLCWYYKEDWLKIKNGLGVSPTS